MLLTIRSRLLPALPAILALALCAASLAAQESKTALLIANGKYSSFGSLANPVPEAQELKSALEALGFQVTLVTNASKDAMVEALADFEASLKRRGGIAFFHYGGHGVQVAGKSYLIPATADIPDEKRVATRALDVDEVMAALDAGGASTSIVVLDACRNNPLPAQAGRSASRGLSSVGLKPRNSITVYSAESGNVAQDGLFTPALTKALGQKGKSFQEMLMEVRRVVGEKSGGTQRPGEYNETTALIYLGAGPAPVAAPTATPSGGGLKIGPAKVAKGNLEVEVKSPGTLSIAGQLVTMNQAGTLPISDLDAGTYPLSVTYPDGMTETLTVTVEGGRTANAAFVYKPSPKASAAGSTFTNSVGMEFKPVAGGSFKMGGTSVTLSPFSMAKTEVTQAQWKAVMGTNPSNFKGDTLPVETVSWYDAVEFCNALSQNEGKQPVYTINDTDVRADLGKNGYRLPTEAEWEYAARGGKEGVASNFKYAGGNTIDEVAWYTTNTQDKGSKPVATKKPNQLGLHDMSGNVWEWCWDWKDSTLKGGADPQGPVSGASRLLRGGSWNGNAGFAESSDRYGSRGPDVRSYDYGFRVVCR